MLSPEDIKQLIACPNCRAIYNGIQPTLHGRLFMFTDAKTGTTFALKPGQLIDLLEDKLEEFAAKWEQK